MRHLSYLLIFIVSLTFIIPSCDPEFLVTYETCQILAVCVGNDPVFFESGDPDIKPECRCGCGQIHIPGQEQGPCGKRCEYRLEDCVHSFRIGEDGDCECFCPGGFMNPPLCQIKKGNYSTQAFHSSQNTNARQMVGTADYFPLWEGNYWEYDAYDSMGLEVVSKFAYVITDTFSLDTLDTVLIYAYDYVFFDTLDMPKDTLLGLMLYDLPADSNQVFNYTNSSNTFMLHHFNYGDTIAMDGPDYTVADSAGTVTVPAGTFNDCIWLRNQDSTGQVLAPDVGMIQMIAEKLKALELTDYNISCEFSIQVDTFGVSDCNTFDGSIDLTTYGNNANLTYTWDGPTAIGNIHNPTNLSVGYYSVTVSNAECSTMIDSIPVAGCANVPVELFDFEAFEFNQHVILEWSTATEINNEYFQVEHSTDGKRFIPIARIVGAVTSFKKLDYSYLHTGAVKGVNFYRLKQVDFGGLYEYSDVVSVSISQIQFSFYPNPAKDRLQIVSPVERFEVILMKHDGTFIKNEKMSSGEYFNIPKLAAGLYLIQIQGDGFREVHPLVIQGY